MSIHRQKRGNRVYLSEYKSVRIGKEVKSIYVRYLGPEDEVKAGKKSKRRILDRLDLARSSRAGDVRLLWRITQDLDFVGIIDRICCQESAIFGPSPGKFLTAWAINRAVDPESCTQLERWVTTTDLPTLLGIPLESFTKDAFLSSLDFICYYDKASQRLVDHTTTIDDTLYHHWRHNHPLHPGDKENVAYDLTSVLLFGTCCPLAELGYNPKNIKRRQVNLALIVSKWDKYPIAHFVYNGSMHTSLTVTNLISRLMDLTIEPGTIVWDRGNVSKEHVKMVESSGWKLICAVPKTSNEVCEILESTDIPFNPKTFAHKSKLGHIYAVRTHGRLFGQERSVVVYVNQDRKSSGINTQNEALAEIFEELDALNKRGYNWSEAKLHNEIDAIVGSWRDYIGVRVKRKGKGPRIEFWYKTREIATTERSHGKCLLLSTDESLSAKDVVKAYFEKDFIEKVFRMLRSNEEIEPVRHRLESRVRAYMFVCVLAYRLLAVLRSMVRENVREVEAWERTFELLRDLSRVERVEIKFGKEVKVCYLNVTRDVEDMLKKIGMKNLLIEERRLAM